MRRELPPSGNLPDSFDRKRGELHGLPDVSETRTSVHRVIEPVLGTTTTYVVQTLRQAEKGDYVFLEVFGQSGVKRIVLPPKVADAIARQRDSLGTVVRRKVGRRVAAERAARGESPAFLRKKEA